MYFEVLNASSVRVELRHDDLVNALICQMHFFFDFIETPLNLVQAFVNTIKAFMHVFLH